MRAPNNTARRILLPQLILTEVVDDTSKAGNIVANSLVPYRVRPIAASDERNRMGGKPNWVPHSFNLFPLVLDGTGAPWAEAALYLLWHLESRVAPRMATYASMADDLAAFRRFLDAEEIDWTHFPAQKLDRPTYRYNGHLKHCVGADEISQSTARRRMSTIIGLYRWLVSENLLRLENSPWKESDRFVEFRDAVGFSALKRVVTTDVSIRVAQQQDPYDGCIDDGGKLKPLSAHEQGWLVEALAALDNIEMTLIHVLSLLTAARIQSVLTLRVRHAFLALQSPSRSDVRLPIGPGTGIDTKFDKKLVLHIPCWFYRQLAIYAQSERAKKRRMRAKLGESEDQFLFLSQRGLPLYDVKSQESSFDPTLQRRHAKCGQGVRQFIHDRVLPFIREKFGVPAFRYSFHDLRATAGMNWTDHQLELVGKGETTLHAAREFVRTRMGHSSAAVTDRYLQFRGNLAQVRHLEQRHESHLVELVEKVMGASNA